MRYGDALWQCVCALPSVLKLHLLTVMHLDYPVKQVCVQLPTSAVNVTLLAFAAAERNLLLCAVLRRRANDGTERQTDGRTDERTTVS